MGYRYPQGRRAKIHRTYTVDDLSRLLKIHKNTIRNWLRQGLEAIDGQRPTLIRGEALRRALDAVLPPGLVAQSPRAAAASDLRISRAYRVNLLVLAMVAFSPLRQHTEVFVAARVRACRRSPCARRARTPGGTPRSPCRSAPRRRAAARSCRRRRAAAVPPARIPCPSPANRAGACDRPSPPPVAAAARQ